TCIHLRHTKFANVLFGDGHVEGCNPPRLKKAGCSEAFDENGNYISF
ncbi:MAG: prepilin-type cleavage/methylation domain-containing protein, partial [Candidatus Omnitrophota bacterium]